MNPAGNPVSRAGMGPIRDRLDMTKNMVHILIMIRINIHEAKTHLSKYLARLRRGEVLMICRRNVPIAEVRAVPPERTAPRPLGLARGEFTIPSSFFDMLPEHIVAGFDGREAP
jgi:antitoxin (DNA-binding transcriptional repressor) of toxin-antitoxin stability system